MRVLAAVTVVAFSLCTMQARADEPAPSDRPVQVKLTPAEAPAQLTEAPVPVVQRWYFWVGVGAVVTGIIVGSVALSVAASQRPFTQADICGGRPCDACIGLTCTAK